MALPIDALETPALLIDESRMDANIARMQERIARLGVGFRPHVKTAKCVEVARSIVGGRSGAITVSTLREADEFAAAGFTDIVYAVGITPNKLPHVASLLARGVRLSIILDNVAAARAVVDFMRTQDRALSVLIEIDCDGHRAGLKPDDAVLLDVATALTGANVELRGVLTHAGASYECKSDAALQAMAEKERSSAVRAALRLRAAGHVAPVVSVGSTPTALSATSLNDVTEVRAGVFVFFDLVMAGIGVCSPQDIALSVLTSVVGHQRDKGWTICDAGWMALSRDRGTESQPVDQGYGLVCDVRGRILDDYVVIAANQEHGTIAHRTQDPRRMLDLPVGTLLRVLPNHACATGAQHASYHVIGADNKLTAEWQRFNGW